MFKLRQTWVGVFDENTLYLLDLRIHAIDPAWPVTAKRNSSLTTGSIHLNPKFFVSLMFKIAIFKFSDALSIRLN